MYNDCILTKQFNKTLETDKMDNFNQAAAQTIKSKELTEDVFSIISSLVTVLGSIMLGTMVFIGLGIIELDNVIKLLG